MVVLGPLRRRNRIHVFTSASRLRQRRLSRRCNSNSRGSAIIIRIRTGIKTGTGTFLSPEWREGDHVCEAVQCRSLGLSLSSGRGLERTYTFDRSHRRTCCHQEYKRIMIIVIVFSIFMLFGLLLYTYYIHGPPTMGQSQSADAFLAVRIAQYYTSCIMYCSLRSHVVILHQTNHAMLTALPQDPSAGRVWTTKSHR